MFVVQSITGREKVGQLLAIWGAGDDVCVIEECRGDMLWLPTTVSQESRSLQERCKAGVGAKASSMTDAIWVPIRR